MLLSLCLLLFLSEKAFPKGDHLSESVLEGSADQIKTYSNCMQLMVLRRLPFTGLTVAQLSVRAGHRSIAEADIS
jgi:hypothetical protein